MTSTLPRSGRGLMSPGVKWNRSTPLFHGVLGVSPTSLGTWKYPRLGPRARTARLPLTNSCRKVHVPALTSGTCVVQVCPGPFRQPAITLPPDSTARLPG